jgi:endonuclease/exonuclease/phosphatase family metal-dependent hydrolase
MRILKIYGIIFIYLFILNNCSPVYNFDLESSSLIEKSYSQDRELKLLSWNIKLFPAPYGWLLKRNQRANNIIQLLKESDPYDAIFFQEAFSGSIRKKIYEALKHIYPFQVEPKDEAAFYRINSGLWVISHSPLTLKDDVIFSKVRETDWLASKGAKLYTINKGGILFNIINTHLQSDYEDKYDDVRQHQYLEIYEKLIFGNTTNEPLILMGDLNITNPKKLNKMLLRLNLKNGPLMGKLKYSLVGKGKKLVDYILIDDRSLKFKSIKRKIIDFPIKFKGKENKFSDHYPLEANIIW